MDVKQLRIIFMGTPEFAVASLQILVENGLNIVGVITSVDKPAGRGMQMQESAVKQYAKSVGLNVLQPTNLKSPEFIIALQEIKADLQVVVAFRMLPEVIWNMPKMGTINVHGSLLPYYRGAAPINWAIINGEPETGVTTFKLKHQIDTGNILLQEKISIKDDETAGSLHDKMKEIGAITLLKTIIGIADESIIEFEQIINEEIIATKKAPKIFTETCEIDWNKSINEIYNLIRGLSPYPAAYTFLKDKKLKIFTAIKEHESHNEKLGDYFTDGKSFLKFACLDGFIKVEQIQIEGKKKMNIEVFLKGFRR